MAAERWVFDDADAAEELAAFSDCLQKMVDEDEEGCITKWLVLDGHAFNLATLCYALNRTFDSFDSYLAVLGREQQLLDIIAGKYPNLKMLMIEGE